MKGKSMTPIQFAEVMAFLNKLQIESNYNFSKEEKELLKLLVDIAKEHIT